MSQNPRRKPARDRGRPDDTRSTAARRPGLRDLNPREDIAAAGQSPGDPSMLILALLGTTLFVGAYYHLLVLQQMTQLTGGLPMPDSMLFGYGREHIAALSAAMDEAARGQLNWVHKTAGVIFPIAVALSTAAVGAWRLTSPAHKWAAAGLGLVFAVVDVAENIAIESAIAAGGEGVLLAATLTVARWALLAAIVVLIVALLARRRPATQEAPPRRG